MLIKTPQRRELGVEPRSTELEDLLRLKEVLQLVSTQILERVTKGQGGGESARGIRQEDLLPISDTKQVSETIERGTEVVTIARRRFSGMNRHPHG